MCMGVEWAKSYEFKLAYLSKINYISERTGLVIEQKRKRQEKRAFIWI